MGRRPRLPGGQALSDHPEPEYNIGRSEDFEQVYDLDDPAPYYAPLARADYRMPAELVGWLQREAAERRPEEGPLRVLDFACGYGFVGALLRHDLSLSEVYAHYASRPWSLGDGRANWDADAATFSERRLVNGPAIELAGLDIAATAVAYAVAVGLIDHGFTDSLVDSPPSPELARYLATVDVVVETGAIGGIYRECFAPIIAAGAGTGPRFVYCPRPSVDLRPLNALWADAGYTVELLGDPVPYRRPITPTERTELLAETTAAGNDPALAFLGDHLAVQMHQASPPPE